MHSMQGFKSGFTQLITDKNIAPHILKLLLVFLVLSLQ